MKSLNIDLLLPTEQRSASPVSFKLIMRIVVLLLVVGIALGVGALVVSVQAVKSQAAEMEQHSADMQPKQKAAEDAAKEVAKFTSMHEEIKGWHRGRIDWMANFDSLRSVVPATIQLLELSINDGVVKLEGVKKGDPNAWKGEMSIRGHGEGETPKADVDAFVASLKGCSNFISDAKVIDFKADDRNPKHREFRLVVTLAPRRLADPDESAGKGK